MKDWGERLQEKSKLEEFERFRKENDSRKQSNAEVIIQLLNNPRVESICIHYERVDEVEKTNIEAKLKEVN